MTRRSRIFFTIELSALTIMIALLFVMIWSALIFAAPRQSGLVLPPADIFVLDNDNSLWRWRACNGINFRKEFPIRGVNGQVIGIDFRVSDGLLYAITDTNQIYTIDTSAPGIGQATPVNPLTIPFAGGVQSLLDFNPVVSAIRLIGSNTQNFAIVNSAGCNLNVTVQQTSIQYAAGDVNAGKPAYLVGGAYTNNYVGAINTLFYGVDFNTDALITIALPLTAAGSSNTGGGQLQTIGPLVGPNGQALNITPTADMDIYSFNGGNILIGYTGNTLFSLDINALTVPPLGSVTPVPVQTLTLTEGGFLDIAVSPKQRRCGRDD